MQTKTAVMASLALFFGVVITVNVTMIVLSVKTADGLVVDHGYEKSLRYGEVIKQRKAQAEYGWKVAVEPPETRTGPVIVTAADAAGRPLDQATVTVTFLRPTKEGLDRTVTLAEADAGRYRATVELPVAGMWDAQVHVRQGERQYTHLTRIRVEP